MRSVFVIPQCALLCARCCVVFYASRGRERLVEAMITCATPLPANVPDRGHYPNHDNSLLYIRA